MGEGIVAIGQPPIAEKLFLSMFKLLIVIAVAAVTASLDLISILTFAGYVLEADAQAIAFLAVAMFLPLAVLGPVYAKATDKFSPQKLLFASLVVRAVATAAMFFVSDVWFLIVLTLLRSVAIGLFYPTIAVAAAEYQSNGKFAAWTNLANSSARVLAPLVGGVLGVMVGEQYVFLASAIACVLILPLVATARWDNGKSSLETQDSLPSTRLGVGLLLLIGLPVVAINGLSVMMSNLMPYTLNLYEVPKITLSIALSLSASTGLLTNIAFVRWGRGSKALPVRQIGLSWLGVCIGFLGLTFAVMSASAAIYVPPMFMLLTLSKTCFTVALMSFTFQQVKPLAARIAAFDQSVGSFGGMLITLLGVQFLVDASPIPMMHVSVLIGIGLCGVWFLYAYSKFGRAAQSNPAA